MFWLDGDYSCNHSTTLSVFWKLSSSYMPSRAEPRFLRCSFCLVLIFPLVHETPSGVTEVVQHESRRLPQPLSLSPSLPLSLPSLSPSPAPLPLSLPSPAPVCSTGSLFLKPRAKRISFLYDMTQQIFIHWKTFLPSLFGTDISSFLYFKASQ